MEPSREVLEPISNIVIIAEGAIIIRAPTEKSVVNYSSVAEIECFVIVWQFIEVLVVT